MSQVVDLLFKQITLGWFQLEPSCPQFTDDSFEPVKMLLWCSTENNYVIQVDDTPIQVQLTKAGFHQALKGCWGIGESKYAHIPKKPSGPMVNAVRGLASSSNSTCQYPDFRSIVENHTAPCKQSKVSSMWGREYPSFTVLLFSLHRSM